MNDIVAALCLAAAIVSAAIFAAVWRHRSRPAAFWLAVSQVGVGLWALGQALSLTSGTLRWTQRWYAITLVGVAIAPTAYLLFAAHYTGRDGWLTRTRTAGVWIVPAAFAVLSVTNVRELVFGNPSLTGSGELAHGWGPAAYGYLLFHEAAMIVALYLLAWKFSNSRNVYRQRTGVLSTAGLVLFVGHLASFFGASPLPGYTTVPVLMVVVGGAAFLLLQGNRTLRLLPFDRLLSPLQGRFENLTPMARDLVIEEMGSGVVVYDADGRIVDLNPMARRILGAENQRVVGKRYDDVVDVDVFVDGRPAFLDEGASEGTFSSIWVDPPGGERRCFDIVLTDLSPEGDGAGGTVTIIHDVTDKQRRKQRLEAQKRELERQNDQLEEFTGIVSHDLRNPLNVARGNVDLARETGDLSHLDAVEESHERMERLIENMLDLARQGRSVRDLEPVALRDAVESAWAGVDTADATLRLPVDEDATIQADPERLQQLLENLFGNAVEHGSTSPDSSSARQDAVEHGGTDVTVTVGADDGGFYVADDGPGIPEGEREAAREQGYTTNPDGTGFGLTIVDTIVEAHGWELTIGESEDGGARFDVSVETDGSKRPSLEVAS